MALVTRLLLVGGALLLISSFIPLRRIIYALPKGQVRRLWFALGMMIALFVAGYTLYALAVWSAEPSFSALVVPIVFFFGACFVFIVNTLSHRTAVDVKRLAALEHESITDPLTGAYNRRYFERRLKEETARAVRYGLPLSVLLLDIDHFKSINDREGHPFGDSVLVSVSHLLMASTRASDVVARYGGDEFAILATNTPASSVSILAERVRGSVEALALHPPHSRAPSVPIPTTVSIGVASLEGSVTDPTRLVACADEALYHAKAEGRNRTATYQAQASPR